MACSLHEAFKLMGPDDDTIKLRIAFHDLLSMEEKSVIKSLTKNFEKVIDTYANENAIESGNNSQNCRNGRGSAGDRSPNIGMHGTVSDKNNEGRKKKHVFLHSNTVNSKELDSLVAAGSVSSKVKAKDDFSSHAAVYKRT